MTSLERLKGELERLTHDTVLEAALKVIEHPTSRKDDSPMVYDNIYFLMKMSVEFRDSIKKLYPYHSFTNSRGMRIPSRKGGRKLIEATSKILDMYKIKHDESYLVEQLERLNRQYDEKEWYE